MQSRGSLMQPRAVLAIDMDAFFAEVERMSRPELRERPIAVQQHSEVTCACHRARALGVRKHMDPSDVRARFPDVVLVSTREMEGGKVTYRDYRKASAGVLDVLRRGAPKGAIAAQGRYGLDEFFVDVTLPATQHGAMKHCPAGVRELTVPGASAASVSPPSSMQSAEEVPTAEVHLLRAAAATGLALQRLVREEVGLPCSVGVSGNMLLAKLACRLAKPEGVAILPVATADFMLNPATMTLTSLPGFGGKQGVAVDLAKAHGISTVAQARNLSLVQLEALWSAARAREVYNHVRFFDDCPVKPRGPPKSMASQCALSPTTVSKSLGLGRAASLPAAAEASPPRKGGRPLRAVSAARPSSWLLPVAPFHWSSIFSSLRALVVDVIDRSREGLDEFGRLPSQVAVSATLFQPTPLDLVFRWGWSSHDATVVTRRLLGPVKKVGGWQWQPAGNGAFITSMEDTGPCPFQGPTLSRIAVSDTEDSALPGRGGEVEMARSYRRVSALSSPLHREDTATSSWLSVPADGWDVEAVLRLCQQGYLEAGRAAALKLGWVFEHGDTLDGDAAGVSASSEAEMAGVSHPCFTLPVCVVTLRVVVGGFRQVRSPSPPTKRVKMIVDDAQSVDSTPEIVVAAPAVSQSDAVLAALFETGAVGVMPPPPDILPPLISRLGPLVDPVEVAEDAIPGWLHEWV
jgi:nucleotidyltransferase/DNA polymerase involved in DNA repair